MILSAAQIAQLASNAGFQGSDLATAVAIALAESNPSGNTDSYNPETAAGAAPGQGSYGLWQIFLAMHPEFAGENLYDPQTNANAAFTVYDAAGGFAPWATFTGGKYQSYLPSASAGVASLNAPLTLDAASGQPIVATPSFSQNIVSQTPGIAFPAPAVAAPGPSFGTVLLWGFLGIAALWVFGEATS